MDSFKLNKIKISADYFMHFFSL